MGGGLCCAVFVSLAFVVCGCTASAPVARDESEEHGTADTEKPAALARSIQQAVLGLVGGRVVFTTHATDNESVNHVEFEGLKPTGETERREGRDLPRHVRRPAQRGIGGPGVRCRGCPAARGGLSAR